MTSRGRLINATVKESLAPKLYTHLTGRSSLSSNEPNWEYILIPDQTGFRGLTSSALVTADCDPNRMELDGHMAFNPGVMRREAVDSDVVCFEPQRNDEHGFAHEPVMFAEHFGSFPPNTLFRVRDVLEPGTWEAMVPGLFPRQRLIVVTATFRKGTDHHWGALEAKLLGQTDTLCLSYGDREQFVKGLANTLLASPLLTMSLEFARDMAWTDHKGCTYNLREEWAYVNGPAKRREGCTPGIRDDRNEGKTLEAFWCEVNDHIRARRNEGHGTYLLEEDAFLTRDEVRAVRLYSGPAYQPVNTFLREVSQLQKSTYKYAVARNPELTFCATVQHIISAIRKLSATVKPDEAREPLWRGVRGELPGGFWVQDKMGMVCAVESGFMSTSKNMTAPLKYMEKGANVLWNLKPGPETDDGYHCGADIAMLSQFGAEAEVLFPPCTLLVVQKQRSRSISDALAEPEPQSPGQSPMASLGGPPLSSDGRISPATTGGVGVHGNLARYVTDPERGCTYLSIDVVPSFI